MRLPSLTGAQWSVCVLDADTGENLAHEGEDRVLRTASVGKLFLLVETARRLVAGELDGTERLVRTADDQLPYISLWDLLDQGELTVRDVAQLTAAVSDNTATNVLLRRVGLDAVTATTRSLGFTASGLLDRVRADRTPDLPPTLSLGTAAELADLLARLHRDEILGAEVSGLVRTWIGANVDTGLVADAFHPDPLEHNTWDRDRWLINKTGTIETARADVGLVRSRERALAWAVIANWDDEVDRRDEVLASMRAIGAVIRDELAAS